MFRLRLKAPVAIAQKRLQDAVDFVVAIATLQENNVQIAVVVEVGGACIARGTARVLYRRFENRRTLADLEVNDVRRNRAIVPGLVTVTKAVPALATSAAEIWA